MATMPSRTADGRRRMAPVSVLVVTVETAAAAVVTVETAAAVAAAAVDVSE